MRVLITGFGPFGEHEINASILAARRVTADGMQGLELEVVELPVEREAADAVLFETLYSIQPDVLLMLGINEHSDAINVERVAINVDDYRIPDNAGAQPRDMPIVDSGPPAYFSTLPVRAMVDDLAAAEIESRVSNSAGTYLCNHVFYSALHRIDADGLACRAGFVHVPQMSEAPGSSPHSRPIDEIVAGLRSILLTLRNGAGALGTRTA